ncbi:hypothetical protein OG320_19370 [Microbispora sp. NBC_01189]|uniref:hypothetical protein n=1 Tax=Microbispora sp. NBC_01189 TaxID=2903583 RepID=UPI002E0F6AEE|nr:hypothetical protein OG320_19370 [Microbispora sp. NBC_01189]
MTLVLNTPGPPTAQAFAAPDPRPIPVTDHAGHADRPGHGGHGGYGGYGRPAGDTARARRAREAGHARGTGQAREVRQAGRGRGGRGGGQGGERGGAWQVTSGVRSANSPQIGSPVRQVSTGRRNVNAPGGNSGAAVTGLQQVAGDSVFFNTLNGGCLPAVAHCGINQTLRSGPAGGAGRGAQKER